MIRDAHVEVEAARRNYWFVYRKNGKISMRSDYARSFNMNSTSLAFTTEKKFSSRSEKKGKKADKAKC
jgi:hypothetical protein